MYRVVPEGETEVSSDLSTGTTAAVGISGPTAKSAKEYKPLPVQTTLFCALRLEEIGRVNSMTKVNFTGWVSVFCCGDLLALRSLLEGVP